jgi:hypothetical protein
MHTIINIGGNEISGIGIKQMNIPLPKLQVISLSKIIFISENNCIGSSGAKYLTKINMPLIK